MDTDSNDLASSGFGNTLTRDGQGSATANLPMNGFKHTGAALATNATDYALFQQIKNGWAGVPTNLEISPSVNSNILTVALKTTDGSTDASSSNPIYIPIRDPNNNGIWTILTVTSAISISTFATGATLGSSNGTPFRLWLVAFNNGGTVVLALINCSNASNIFPLNESALVSATPISGSATSAGVFYAPNGTTLTSKPFRILGYFEYPSGLATAGSYASPPTLVQPFGPGNRKPGDIVQVVYATATSGATVSGANTNMGVGASITPTSNVNPIKADFGFAWTTTTGSPTTTFFISRGTAPSSIGAQYVNLGNSSGQFNASSNMTALDGATTTSRPSYNLYASGTVNGLSLVGGQSVVLTELMG